MPVLRLFNGEDKVEHPGHYGVCSAPMQLSNPVLVISHDSSTA